MGSHDLNPLESIYQGQERESPLSRWIIVFVLALCLTIVELGVVLGTVKAIVWYELSTEQKSPAP